MTPDLQKDEPKLKKRRLKMKLIYRKREIDILKEQDKEMELVRKKTLK